MKVLPWRSEEVAPETRASMVSVVYVPQPLSPPQPRADESTSGKYTVPALMLVPKYHCWPPVVRVHDIGEQSH